MKMKTSLTRPLYYTKDISKREDISVYTTISDGGTSKKKKESNHVPQALRKTQASQISRRKEIKEINMEIDEMETKRSMKQRAGSLKR
jgi:hypothetical protein